MKTLFWNCRGLGAPRPILACQKLIKERHPSLVFLMETKLKSNEAEKLNSKVGFKFAVWVDYAGEDRRRAGGLGLL